MREEPMAAYGNPDGTEGARVAVLIAGVLATVLLVIVRTREGLWELLWIVFSLVPTVGAAAYVFLPGWLRREQDAMNVQDLLKREGFRPLETNKDKQRAYKTVAHLTDRLFLAGGAVTLSWAATADDGVLLFEHYYVMGTGAYRTHSICTVIVVPAAHPTMPGALLGLRPWATIIRAPLSERGLMTMAGVKKTIGDDAFDAAWMTLGDVETARTFAQGRARSLLDTSPFGEAWDIGDGFVCCAYRYRASAKDLSIMLTRVRDALA